jgi:hypothetical protein
MDTRATPHVHGVLLVILIFVLTLADGLCCTWFTYPILCWYCVLRIGHELLYRAWTDRSLLFIVYTFNNM